MVQPNYKIKYFELVWSFTSTFRNIFYFDSWQVADKRNEGLEI